MNITKQSLFRMINEYALDMNQEPIDKSTFIKTLSSLEIQGYIETQGDEVIVLKEYPGR